MKFYSFPGSSQFPYAAKISQRIPRIPFKNIAKGYYVKKTNKHQMWKERAPRRYTILWFWSQYFDCVDINLASFALLHPLHPHPPPPTPSQGFVNTTSANIRMVGGSPPNDSNAQWTSCMAYSQKRLKKKRKENEKKKNYLSKTSDWGHNLVLYNYEQIMSWIQFLPHVIKFCAFNWTTCLLKIYESFCSF